MIFSEKCKNFVLASDVKDIPTIRIVVLSIERKGDTACSAEILDKNGNVVCKISKIFGEGGTFGTKLNLIKDVSWETETQVSVNITAKMFCIRIFNTLTQFDTFHFLSGHINFHISRNPSRVYVNL